MKIVVQRVGQSSVTVENKIISKIGAGLNLLVCMEKGDDQFSVDKAVKKILALRIFSDENSRMNKNIKDVGGEILAVSQFTLSWDGTKGNRPSFDNSMDPQKAQELFEKFYDGLNKEVPTQQGAFGASMRVEIINDGPVTFSLSF
jgi:D-tyrosyl-tRNA(Tyr) deacylase